MRARGPVVDVAKLDVAFAALRKQGLVARKNYWCCNSCAGYDLGIRLGKATEKQLERMKGAVSFCKQSGEVLRSGGDLHLSYGRIEHWGKNDLGGDAPVRVSAMTTKEVGDLARKALTDAGLAVEWDGKPETRIIVKAVAS